MSRLLVACLWRNGLRALAVLLPFSTAVAAPIYNIPITVYGQFYGGGSLTGTFSLNVYGQPNSYFTFTLGAGISINSTPIPGVTLSSALADHLGVTGGQPNTTSIVVQTPNTDDNLYVTFQHALNIAGPDPFVIEENTFTSSPESGQCYGYSCETSSELRLLASGAAEVPEPTPLALLASGLLALWAVRRHAAGPRG